MEEDNQKSPSCPDFVIPSKDQPFDVYKTNTRRDKSFLFPNKSRSSTARQWLQGLKKGGWKKILDLKFQLLRFCLDKDLGFMKMSFIIAMIIFWILLLEV